MTEDQAFETVAGILTDIVHRRGGVVDRIDRDSLILGGDLPIDSLDLATVVVELEAATGLDPFKDGFIEFQTVGELARLYVS